MLSLVSTPDEDSEVVDFLTATLQAISEDKAKHIVIAYILDDTGEMNCYNACTYGDLRRLATAINDEATIRMIAANQDRIEYFKQDYESTVENDDG